MLPFFTIKKPQYEAAAANPFGINLVGDCANIAVLRIRADDEQEVVKRIIKNQNALCPPSVQHCANSSPCGIRATENSTRSGRESSVSRVARMSFGDTSSNSLHKLENTSPGELSSAGRSRLRPRDCNRAGDRMRSPRSPTYIPRRWMACQRSAKHLKAPVTFISLWSSKSWPNAQSRQMRGCARWKRGSRSWSSTAKK